jgi:hypothetical protein
MLRMLQGIRGAAQLRMGLFQGFARAGMAVLFVGVIAGSASAQTLAPTDPPAQQAITSGASEIAPPSDAPPRSITQRYTPAAPRPRGEMSLLVDAPPAPGAPARGPVSSAATGGEIAIGDRIDGPAINMLATGRTAITVSVGGARNR